MTHLRRSPSKLLKELLAVPAAALAMTRSMTSALGRSASGMSLGWADADLQQWALTEEEYKETVRSYAGNWPKNRDSVATHSRDRVTQR